MSNNLKTQKQQEILTHLSTNFGIDEARVLFINPRDENDPWIPADELESIARQLSGFKQSSVLHDKFIPETNQIAYIATVVDKNDVTFTRSGVATIGEKPNGIEIEADVLAAGRALSAALRAAGFHPYRSGSVVNFSEMKEEIEAKRIMESIPQVEHEAVQRTKDLRQIHVLAAEKGLIVIRAGVKDDSEYRRKLQDKFGVGTAVMLDQAHRAQVINWLKNYDSFLENVPEELREDALVA
ncbi:MAG TPA: hypothetical protein PKY59_07640 [Pyrinomonadaceae bacterium]|nr:hypothetical protein [Pyrinomonadaceae bacterium]